MALIEASPLVGTPEYESKMVEYRRYTLMADYMDKVNGLHQADVYHEGSKSYYTALLLKRISPEEALYTP
jgi:gamma-glutamylcysteine synthetase